MSADFVLGVPLMTQGEEPIPFKLARDGVYRLREPLFGKGITDPDQRAPLLSLVGSILGATLGFVLIVVLGWQTAIAFVGGLILGAYLAERR